MENDAITLNKKIKDARLKKGLTLSRVAKHLGVSSATVQRYESGEIKNIKYDIIIRLAELYNVTPSYLMGWGDNNRLVGNNINTPNNLSFFQDNNNYSQQAALEMKILLEYVMSKMDGNSTDITEEIRYVNEYLLKKYRSNDY